MIKVKTGVTPKMLVIMAAMANTAEEMGFVAVVTSGRDSKHMTGSKHYTGNALDFRTHNFSPETLAQIMSSMKARLGRDYDVVLESDHLHVEYDPR